MCDLKKQTSTPFKKSRAARFKKKTIPPDPLKNQQPCNSKRKQ